MRRRILVKRVVTMARETKNSDYIPVRELIPRKPTLDALRAAAAGCTGCDLYVKATQTVFGEGRANARVMLVGEQPGDREDVAGRPFVGPAGRVLDEALREAGIDRQDVYLTNVVKHFRWEGAARGKRRIHKKPRAWEIQACRPWLDAELAVVQPEALVCLGASSAQALLGRNFSVMRQRGELLLSNLAPVVMATVHPSSILRAPDSETRRREMKAFVRDLKKVVRALESHQKAA
ncbi:MAG TPA: UdgX family uracil-DNA binding protein [Terriglobales bacterium]